MGEYTNMVSFLPDEKLILIHDNVTSVDVENNVYFAWKRWLTQGNNMAYRHALEWTAGIPDGSGVMHPIFYLVNGWHLRTWEGDHTLVVYGHLYSITGEPAFVETIGNFNTLIDMQVYNTINTNLALRLDDMANKLNELLAKGDGQDSMLNAILDDSTQHRDQMDKIEDLVYQVLGLSRSNFKIINPVYQNGNVTASTIETFKSRADMLSSKVFKTYKMSSELDDMGRMINFKVIETAESVTNTPLTPSTPASGSANTTPDLA